MSLQKFDSYWEEQDKKNLKLAKTFEDLRIIAFQILCRMYSRGGRPGIVCGPISTGGLGSVRKNMVVFGKTIELLRVAGFLIFSQLPFEGAMHRIMKDKSYYRGGNHLLETFYLPLFESGLIRNFYFLSGWRTSFGASWEHKQAKRLRRTIDITIHYLASPILRLRPYGSDE